MEMQDYSKDEKVLEKFGRDVTESVREGKIDPVIGREEEICRQPDGAGNRRAGQEGGKGCRQCDR